MDTLLTWVVCAVGLCGAELAYWLPLKKRRNFPMRTALNFIAAVLFAQVIIWANSGHAKPAMLLVIYGGYFIWAAVSTHLCTFCRAIWYCLRWRSYRRFSASISFCMAAFLKSSVCK